MNALAIASGFEREGVLRDYEVMRERQADLDLGHPTENPTLHPTRWQRSLTIEARWNRPVRVKWINDLKDASGDYLPHLLPVDQTLHWANPAGGAAVGEAIAATVVGGLVTLAIFWLGWAHRTGRIADS